jgi:hypothetical protein
MKTVLGLIVAGIATAACADGQQPIVINNYITQTQTAPPPAVFNNNSQPNNVLPSNNNVVPQAMPQYSNTPQYTAQSQLAPAPAQMTAPIPALQNDQDTGGWAQPEPPVDGPASTPAADQSQQTPPAAYTGVPPDYVPPTAPAPEPQTAAYVPAGPAVVAPPVVYVRRAQFRPSNDAGALRPTDGNESLSTHVVNSPPVPLTDLPQHPEQTPGIVWGPTKVTPVDVAGHPIGPTTVIPPRPVSQAGPAATQLEEIQSEDPNAKGPIQTEVPN